MTELTARFKSDRCDKRKIVRLKKPKYFKSHPHHPHHTYTNFSGNYGQSLTAEELSEDLKYAEAVRRQKFW